MPDRFFQKDKNDFLALARLDIPTIKQLIERSLAFFDLRRQNKELPKILAGKSVATLFLENSTRTRASFELAAQLGGANVVSINQEGSSLKKGETVQDTVLTLDAMGFDILVIRQTEDELPFRIASQMQAALVNAGSGVDSHPSQALLDVAVMTREFGDLKDKKITICGDILHSRVAASLFEVLPKLGARLTLVGPDNFMLSPEKLSSFELTPGINVDIKSDLDAELKDSDAVICLRVQKERMAPGEFPDVAAYHARYGLTFERAVQLPKRSIILHPGPMNRGIEIASAVANDHVAESDRVRILTQVEMGVSARLAILEFAARAGNVR